MLHTRILGATAFAPAQLLPAPVVCDRLSITPMSLHRWLHGYRVRKTGRNVPPLADFPRPIVINSRRYWVAEQIEEFIARRAGNSPTIYPDAKDAA